MIWAVIWEQFFNWQSDLDWAWGPLLPLRPPPDTAIRPWVWVRLFLLCTVLGVLLLALGVLVCVLLPRFAYLQHWSLPPPVTETLATLRVMATHPGTRLLLIGLGLSLPPLFFAFCLPYHWAWNRRAARLQNESVPEMISAQAHVWPPAIRTYPAQVPTLPKREGRREGYRLVFRLVVGLCQKDTT